MEDSENDFLLMRFPARTKLWVTQAYALSASSVFDSASAKAGRLRRRYASWSKDSLRAVFAAGFFMRSPPSGRMTVI